MGRFDHVRRAIILHPEVNRTSFHLVYATRHSKGVEVFKEAEKLAMAKMETLRGQAQDRRRESLTGNMNLFAEQEIPASAHYGKLRERYILKAREGVLHLLTERKRISYDDACAEALAEPLVWESDLRDWILDWQKASDLELTGLKKGVRMPKRNAGHELIWRAQASR